MRLVVSHQKHDAELRKALQLTATQLEDYFHQRWAGHNEDDVLLQAMRYASMGAGKRLRPFLVMMSARLFGISDQAALQVAAAVEAVHCYSLVHDDLPALDNDDMRRGRAATHIAFSEATAILAGDALLAFAFEILSEEETHPDPRVRIALVKYLAQAAGANGMVGGQMMDMFPPEQSDMSFVTRLQRLKTGALFAFSCESGAILGKAEKNRRQALSAYAHDLGLAFQIIDDVLDVTGTREETGKTTGKDYQTGKATFVALLGVERARNQARLLCEQAVRHLDVFDSRADYLRHLASYILNRRS